MAERSPRARRPGRRQTPVRPRNGRPADSPPPASIEVKGGQVHINALIIGGAVATLVSDAIAAGDDVELKVRHALEVGAAVLLHGTAKGTVDAVSAEVSRLLTALDDKSRQIEILRQAREKIASKGLGFEDALAPALEACFASHKDIVQNTSTSAGIADDKVGDFVVTVDPEDSGGGHHRNIVFEAKDRAMALKPALAELDAAMVNRAAQVAVMVFAHASQAPIPKPLRLFSGNRLMVVWDAEGDGSDLALEVGAQLARALAISVERDDGKLRPRMLANRLDKVVNIIEQADDIDRGLQTVQRGLTRTKTAYAEMRNEALAILYELQDQL